MIYNVKWQGGEKLVNQLQHAKWFCEGYVFNSSNRIEIYECDSELEPQYLHAIFTGSPHGYNYERVYSRGLPHE